MQYESFVFNFLGNLFENNYEYSTINSNRSDSPVYHNLVEGSPVGQHISVCNSVTGVFNKNPPNPKYVFIRDVGKVLRYIKTLPTNTKSSDRTFLLKLTSLLFPTSVGSWHKISYLYKHYLVKTVYHTNSAF